METSKTNDDLFVWENGTLIEPAKVEINGVTYEVIPAQYEGKTPLSATNLNNAFEIIDNKISKIFYNEEGEWILDEDYE